MIQFAVVGLLFLISGCCRGPLDKNVKIKLPENYSIVLGDEHHGEKVCWWKSFENAELEGLLEKGLQQNFDVKIALEKIEESRNLNRIAIAKILPQLDFFSGVFKANLGNGLLSRGLQNTCNITSTIAAIDTLWEIDIWGRLRRNQKVAQYQWEAQIEDMRDALIMYAAEIVQTYINICALQQKIKILRSSLEADQQILRLYKDTFNAGLDAKQLSLEQKTSTQQFETQIIELKINQKLSFNKLAFLIGQTPDQLMLNMDVINEVPSPKTEVQIDKPYELLRRRPDIRKSERLLAASYEQIGSAMAEWFPKISLLGFLGRPSTSGPGICCDGDAKIWAVGPLINWPILDFGRIYFNIKVKESGQRQALITYEKTVINAVKEVENYLTSYFEEKRKLHILEEKSASEEKRLSLTKELFKSGIESEFATLINQKRLNDITFDLIDSQEKIASNFIALYKAFGGDW